MQVTDKLTKALTEAKYLNADNVSRYRCIMRIFLKIMKTPLLAVPGGSICSDGTGSVFCGV